MVAAIKLVLITHISTSAGINVRVDFCLGIAVAVDTSSINALRTRPAIGAATNNSMFDINGAVRTCRAGGR